MYPNDRSQNITGWCPKVCSIVLLMFIHTANGQSIINGEYEKLYAEITDIIELLENEVYLSDINNVAFNDDRGEIYIVSSRIAQFAIFTTDGLFKKTISNWGKGPYEYDVPFLVKVVGNSLYLWDQASLKIIEYDFDGNGLNEYRGFTTGAKDFNISHDKNRIAIIANTPQAEGYIRIYDLSTMREQGELSRYGNGGIKFLVLTMIYSQSGKFAFNNDRIIYGPADESQFTVLDINTGTTNSYIHNVLFKCA